VGYLGGGAWGVWGVADLNLQWAKRSEMVKGSQLNSHRTESDNDVAEMVYQIMVSENRL
jgi:hypothetical protein